MDAREAQGLRRAASERSLAASIAGAPTSGRKRVFSELSGNEGIGLLDFPGEGVAADGAPSSRLALPRSRGATGTEGEGLLDDGIITLTGPPSGIKRSRASTGVSDGLGVPFMLAGDAALTRACTPLLTGPSAGLSSSRQATPSSSAILEGQCSTSACVGPIPLFSAGAVTSPGRSPGRSPEALAAAAGRQAALLLPLRQPVLPAVLEAACEDTPATQEASQAQGVPGAAAAAGLPSVSSSSSSAVAGVSQAAAASGPPQPVPRAAAPSTPQLRGAPGPGSGSGSCSTPARRPASLLPTLDRKHVSLTDIPHITTDTLVEALSGKYTASRGVRPEDICVVDCRYPFEYGAGHIAGAVNIYEPLTLFEALILPWVRNGDEGRGGSGSSSNSAAPAPTPISESGWKLVSDLQAAHTQLRDALAADAVQNIWAFQGSNHHPLTDGGPALEEEQAASPSALPPAAHLRDVTSPLPAGPSSKQGEGEEGPAAASLLRPVALSAAGRPPALPTTATNAAQLDDSAGQLSGSGTGGRGCLSSESGVSAFHSASQSFSLSQSQSGHLQQPPAALQQQEPPQAPPLLQVPATPSERVGGAAAARGSRAAAAAGVVAASLPRSKLTPRGQRTPGMEMVDDDDDGDFGFTVPPSLPGNNLVSGLQAGQGSSSVGGDASTSSSKGLAGFSLPPLRLSSSTTSFIDECPPSTGRRPYTVTGFTPMPDMAALRMVSPADTLGGGSGAGGAGGSAAAGVSRTGWAAFPPSSAVASAAATPRPPAVLGSRPPPHAASASGKPPASAAKAAADARAALITPVPSADALRCLKGEIATMPASASELATHPRPRILVFHCEFSQNRGPEMLRTLRELDRALHRTETGVPLTGAEGASRPSCLYPHVFLLYRGYSGFWESGPARSLCTPCAYLPMSTASCAPLLILYRIDSRLKNNVFEMALEGTDLQLHDEEEVEVAGDDVALLEGEEDEGYGGAVADAEGAVAAAPRSAPASLECDDGWQLDGSGASASASPCSSTSPALDTDEPMAGSGAAAMPAMPACVIGPAPKRATSFCSVSTTAPLGGPRLQRHATIGNFAAVSGIKTALGSAAAALSRQSSAGSVSISSASLSQSSGAASRLPERSFLSQGAAPTRGVSLGSQASAAAAGAVSSGGSTSTAHKLIELSNRKAGGGSQSSRAAASGAGTSGGATASARGPATFRGSVLMQPTGAPAARGAGTRGLGAVATAAAASVAQHPLSSASAPSTARPGVPASALAPPPPPPLPLPRPNPAQLIRATSAETIKSARAGLPSNSNRKDRDAGSDTEEWRMITSIAESMSQSQVPSSGGGGAGGGGGGGVGPDMQAYYQDDSMLMPLPPLLESSGGGAGGQSFKGLLASQGGGAGHVSSQSQGVPPSQRGHDPIASASGLPGAVRPPSQLQRASSFSSQLTQGSEAVSRRAAAAVPPLSLSQPFTVPSIAVPAPAAAVEPPPALPGFKSTLPVFNAAAAAFAAGMVANGGLSARSGASPSRRPPSAFSASQAALAGMAAASAAGGVGGTGSQDLGPDLPAVGMDYDHLVSARGGAAAIEAEAALAGYDMVMTSPAAVSGLLDGMPDDGVSAAAPGSARRSGIAGGRHTLMSELMDRSLTSDCGEDDASDVCSVSSLDGDALMEPPQLYAGAAAAAEAPPAGRLNTSLPLVIPVAALPAKSRRCRSRFANLHEGGGSDPAAGRLTSVALPEDEEDGASRGGMVDAANASANSAASLRLLRGPGPGGAYSAGVAHPRAVPGCPLELDDFAISNDGLSRGSASLAAAAHPPALAAAAAVVTAAIVSPAPTNFASVGVSPGSGGSAFFNPRRLFSGASSSGGDTPGTHTAPVPRTSSAPSLAVSAPAAPVASSGAAAPPRRAAFTEQPLNTASASAVQTGIKAFFPVSARPAKAEKATPAPADGAGAGEAAPLVRPVAHKPSSAK